MLLVKKYPNRRLYDTRNSRYITLGDLEKTVRGGEDVAVQDAQDGRDLTQETLTQIILDRNGGRILPASLLLRLIRLDDAALGEFLTRYVGWALDMYLTAKDRARALLPLNPLATAPFAATDALARLVLGATQWGRGTTAPADVSAPPLPIPHGAHVADIEMPPDPDAPPEAYAPEPIPQEFRTAPFPTAPAANTTSDFTDEMLRMRQEIEALKASVSRPKTKSKAKPKKKPTKRA
jgi:polyhydroxyalkanoate synthesis repressor PhaR